MMMQRSIVLTIVCMGLFALSCPPPPHAGDSPKAQTSVAGLRPAESGPDDDSEQNRILALLREQHTALSEGELIELARTIEQEATRHGFDPALVMAVIEVESGGYHLAVSPVGALGLMQILPGTAEELANELGVEWHGADSLFDPVVNVKIGTAYLRQLSDRYDSVPTALAAYNWGPTRIDRRLRTGAALPSRYVRRVLKAYGARERNGARRS